MKKYKVRAFHDSLGDRPITMELSLLPNGKLQLAKETGEDKFEWSIDSLKIEKGGANNQLFLFTHLSYPGWVLYIRDNEFIKEFKARYPHKKIPHRNILDSGVSLVITTALLILVTLSLFFVFKDSLVNGVVKMVPIKVEKKLGGIILNNLIGTQQLQKNSTANKELQNLLSPLFALGAAKGYEFNTFIVDDNSLNAFALPGGYLIFNRGMLLAAENVDEIFGVAAHEMSHVVKRHTLKQMVSSLGTYAIVRTFFGDVSGIVAVLADNSTFLLSRVYSRQAEEEADLNALFYLKQLQINPHGLIHFFEKLQKEHDRKIKELEKNGIPGTDLKLNFLSTHPATEDRIAYLLKNIEEQESVGRMSYKTPIFDLQKFKHMLNKSSEVD
ncbi:MAG: M48 family metallopeptidase [Bdellovibrionales bacterium]|nr:M48 family metallopeptidase [Bdellovibrionales bacterium]